MKEINTIDDMREFLALFKSPYRAYGIMCELPDIRCKFTVNHNMPWDDYCYGADWIKNYTAFREENGFDQFDYDGPYELMFKTRPERERVVD